MKIQFPNLSGSMQQVPFTQHPIKRYPKFDRNAQRIAIAMGDPTSLSVRADQMCNQRYTVLVYDYAFQQKRIQVTDIQKPDGDAPPGHGTIVKQLCTYHEDVAVSVVAKLQASEDPIECVESLRKPWNSEGPDDVVRLDTTEEDNPYRGKG